MSLHHPLARPGAVYYTRPPLAFSMAKSLDSTLGVVTNADPDNTTYCYAQPPLPNVNVTSNSSNYFLSSDFDITDIPVGSLIPSLLNALSHVV